MEVSYGSVIRYKVYRQGMEVPNDQSYVIKYSQCGGAYGSGFN